MARPSLRGAVAWIAVNDEPLILDEEEMSGLISVLLTADMFDVAPEKVAKKVVDYRRKANESQGVVVKWLFPRGSMEKIREFARGMKSMRQVAEEFEYLGVTRTMLMDIDNQKATWEEADVKRVKRSNE